MPRQVPPWPSVGATVLAHKQLPCLQRTAASQPLPGSLAEFAPPALGGARWVWNAHCAVGRVSGTPASQAGAAVFLVSGRCPRSPPDTAGH